MVIVVYFLHFSAGKGYLDLAAISFNLVCISMTLSYAASATKAPISGGASPYNPLYGVPSPGVIHVNVKEAVSEVSILF